MTSLRFRSISSPGCYEALTLKGTRARIHMDFGMPSFHNWCVASMSQLGHSRHFGRARFTSGLPRLADIRRAGRHVPKVPNPEMASSNGAPAAYANGSMIRLARSERSGWDVVRAQAGHRQSAPRIRGCGANEQFSDYYRRGRRDRPPVKSWGESDMLAEMTNACLLTRTRLRVTFLWGLHPRCRSLALLRHAAAVGCCPLFG
jgi:hypothetical protein